jgi:hypothetical protein
VVSSVVDIAGKDGVPFRLVFPANIAPALHEWQRGG